MSLKFTGAFKHRTALRVKPSILSSINEFVLSLFDGETPIGLSRIVLDDSNDIYAYSSTYLIKLDSQLRVQWALQSTTGIFRDVKYYDGHLYVLSQGVYKFNLNGNQVWGTASTVNGSSATSIDVSPEGIMITGAGGVSSRMRNVVALFDFDGAFQWAHNYLYGTYSGAQIRFGLHIHNGYAYNMIHGKWAGVFSGATDRNAFIANRFNIGTQAQNYVNLRTRDTDNPSNIHNFRGIDNYVLFWGQDGHSNNSRSEGYVRAYNVASQNFALIRVIAFARRRPSDNYYYTTNAHGATIYKNNIIALATSSQMQYIACVSFSGVLIWEKYIRGEDGYIPNGLYTRGDSLYITGNGPAALISMSLVDDDGVLITPAISGNHANVELVDFEDLTDLSAPYPMVSQGFNTYSIQNNVTDATAALSEGAQDTFAQSDTTIGRQLTPLVK